MHYHLDDLVDKPFYKLQLEESNIQKAVDLFSSGLCFKLHRNADYECVFSYCLPTASLHPHKLLTEKLVSI